MSAPMSKFSSFNVHDDFVYKNVDGVAIKTAILVPKSLKPGMKAPVLVHMHGGGFMTGNRLFEPWFALWCARIGPDKDPGHLLIRSVGSCNGQNPWVL